MRWRLANIFVPMSAADNIQKTLEQAVDVHQRGDFARAKLLYRAVLEQDPDQEHALHLLGVIAMQSGKFDEAVSMIGRAAELSPRDPHMRANLGNAMLQVGDARSAVEQYEAALAIDSNLTEVRRNLATALLSLGRAGDAIQEISEAARKAPRSLEVQVTLGNILSETGRSDEAIACFERILSVKPDIAPIHGNLANVLRQAGRIDEAITRYKKALALAPGYAELHYDLGVAYQVLGERTTAEASFRKALDLDPQCSKAWRALAGLRKDNLSDSDLATIETELESNERANDQRTYLAFAAGKCREDRLEHARAFEHFERGNTLHRSGISYSLELDEEVFDNTRNVFDEAFFERWSGVGSDDTTPIFIVGMPRSGTTLAEQILASHSNVFGAGELPTLYKALASRFTLRHGLDYSAVLESATADDFGAIAQQYLDAIRALGGAAGRITDKLPANFLNLGAISVLFPKATVIHCRRDPRDTCFSIYKHYFSALGHDYAYDLEELGAYYNLYRSLMAHWARVLPISIHEFEYEAVIADVETSTRALLDACELPWEPACLEFHKTRRPVATMSADQVRRPIYADSVGAWRRHEEKLAPLLSILDV
jgi:tetratricopeptide (TPR) repeat protein